VRTALVLVAALVLSACGGDDGDGDGNPGDIDAPVANLDGGPGDGAVAPRETSTHTLTLGPGQSDEAELRLAAGTDTIHIRIAAVANPTLAWNVHTHSAGETQILEEHSGVDAVDFVITGPANDYSFLIVNGGASLTFDVAFDLYGTATYTSGFP
jgi:hypothetical protein